MVEAQNNAPALPSPLDFEFRFVRHNIFLARSRRSPLVHASFADEGEVLKTETLRKLA